MGKTYTKKIEGREERLKNLPRNERLKKNALIKKKEGRVLTSDEKHALTMSSEVGEALRLWEVLRTINADGIQGLSEAQEKRQKKRLLQKAVEKATLSAPVGKIAAGMLTKFSEDDTEDEREDIEGMENLQSDEASKKGGKKVKKESIVMNRFEHKYPTIDNLFKIIEPKFKNYVRTPKLSRAIQSMIKYGSPQHLEKLFKFLSEDLLFYCNDAFAHYVVIALVKHATASLFHQIVTKIILLMPQLVTHVYGLRVIHVIYCSKVCHSREKDMVVLSIYKDSNVMTSWKGYPVLENILVHNLDQRKRLLIYLFNLIDKLVNQKQSYTLPFVQRLLFIYFSYGTKHEIMELCESIRPHLSVIADSSKEGALLCNITFVLLEPKARKEPLRLFSEDFVNKACGKHTSPVIARFFDVVYDLQLLQKYVVQPLIDNLPDVINSSYGYQILIHLYTPEADRRSRLLLHFWDSYNLYSNSNSNWNKHTWFDSNYTEETVEICPKDAEKNHIAVLSSLTAAFLKLLQKQDQLNVNTHHVGVIAREMVHLSEHNETYKEVFMGVDGTLLKSKMSKKEEIAGGSKRDRVETKVGESPKGGEVIYNNNKDSEHPRRRTKSEKETKK